MRGRKGWWPLAAAGAGLAALVLLLVVTVAPLGAENGLTTSANTAQLTALLVAVGTAAVLMVRWAWQTIRSTRAAAAPTTDALAHAKDVLAGVVAEQWRHEAALRSLDDPDPIPVRWRAPAPAQRSAALMDHPANIETTRPTESGVWWTASSADIGALADRFRRIRRRRLVILGGPGTGKTTLAMQLLLHLLATRDRHPDDPVPVMLPVAGWDTEEFPRLHDWLADRLPRDYPMLRSPSLGLGIARSLTARGHILPVLDGLDELPAPAQANVITALNRSLSNDDQLILTSRTIEFAAAVTAAGDVVTSAAVLEPRPLDPAAAADYLAGCLPPRSGPIWHQILTDLRKTSRADQSGPDQGPMAALADVAATPLGLWLLRSVYTAPGADPAPLADPERFPTPAALRAHLFDHLIDALIVSRPPSTDPAEPFRPRRRHDPALVRRRLGYLAHHLSRQPATAGSDTAQGTRDFAWWRLAATSPAVTRIALFAILFIPVPMGGLAFGLRLGIGGIALGLGLGVSFALAFVLSAKSWVRDSPGYANLSFRQRSDKPLRKLVGGLLTGLAFGLLFALPGGLPGEFPGGPLGWLVVGLGMGLPLGLMVWAETPAHAHQAATPVGSWRADRTLNLLRIGAVGVAFGVASGLGGGLEFGLEFGVSYGLWAGIAIGRHRAWSAYLVATWRLALAGRLPRRLMPFLDDCHRLGLLRAVGPIYQFRHADLHDHLAATYQRPA